MSSQRLKRVALSLVIAQVAAFAAAQAPLYTRTAAFQFGYPVMKLLEQFHLPGSPDKLLGFLLEYALSQKIGTTLPLKLDANAILPTVENSALPGGPFRPQTLAPTVVSLRTPLAPGDYVIPVMAYCTQYSVHRPGLGTAYKLAPIGGTKSSVISTLLWRGTLAGRSPQELQAASWAIQAGVNYDKLPKPYQNTIDQLIPDYKDKLKGNPIEVIESTYAQVSGDPRKYLQTYLKERFGQAPPLMLLPKIAIPAPPLEAVLGKMGPSGLLVLDAKKQSNIFLAQYTTQEKGEQILFAGQGQALPPQPAAEGAWTVRVPDTAWVRFKVQGGNMQNNNLLEIRIASGPTQQNVNAAESKPAVPATSILGLLGVDTMADAPTLTSTTTLNASGLIGYSQGVGAQALIPVAILPAQPAPVPVPTVTITKMVYNPVKYPTEEAPLGARGACIYLGAKFSNPSTARDYRWVQWVKTNRPDKCPAEGFYDNGKCSPSFAFYRPAPTEPSWRNYFGFDYVFRDIPNRGKEVQGTSFEARLTLERANNGENKPTESPLVRIEWGFSIDQESKVLLTPMKVTGATFVDGDPTLTDDYKKHMCDANWIANWTRDQKSDLNVAVDKLRLTTHEYVTPTYIFSPEIYKPK